MENEVITLDDLMDPLDLEQAIEAGYVRTQTHPVLPYVIHNYAEIAVFERAWTPATRQSRGLIVHAETRQVLARPFDKFFNHDEPDAFTASLDDPVTVTDKADGSLGILYPTDGGWAVATRGSFASEQAQHATALFQDRYADTFTGVPGITYLFEIVYPENRIVVDYGQLDDLVLLGGRDIATGATVSAHDLPWDGPRITTFPHASLAQALAAEPRPGMEGLVVEFRTTGERVKIKQAEYVRLHKIVTGLNARGVWEALGSGQTVADICADLPDEFHGWVREVADDLQAQADAIVADAERAHRMILAGLPDGWERKAYAMVAKDSPLRGYLFQLLDARDIAPAAWKAIRPEAYWTPAGRRSADAEVDAA
jgi:RNA ligase